MQIKNITTKLSEVKTKLESERVSPEVRALIDILILIIEVLLERKLKNSKNSSVPPSQDPNRVKKSKQKSIRPQGGQEGHTGTTLVQVEEPNEIISLLIDRRTLPKDEKFKSAEPEVRQVVDLEIKAVYKEYQAEVLVDTQGRRYVAKFPFGVNKSIQFSPSVKANAVYMDNYQFASIKRIEEHFMEQLGIKVSHGSIVNFSVELSKMLTPFMLFVKERLLQEKVLHADETGININGHKAWVHTISSLQFSYLYASESRGKIAIEEMDVLNHYNHYLCHDHWQAYFSLWCSHFLCNAHHVRELTYAEEEDNQTWAKKMRILLLDTNKEVQEANGKLSLERQEVIIKRYRKILKDGDKECSEALPKEEGQRGRQKKPKSRNLLERLLKYETETLAFMKNVEIPFTNNEAERDLRMTKVQQKVAGCFKTIESAQVFARIRSFINTCKKNQINISDAIKQVFEGKLDEILQQIQKSP